MAPYYTDNPRCLLMKKTCQLKPSQIFILYQYVIITKRHSWSDKVTLHVYCNLHFERISFFERTSFYFSPKNSTVPATPWKKIPWIVPYHTHLMPNRFPERPRTPSKLAALFVFCRLCPLHPPGSPSKEYLALKPWRCIKFEFKIKIAARFELEMQSLSC